MSPHFYLNTTSICVIILAKQAISVTTVNYLWILIFIFIIHLAHFNLTGFHVVSWHLSQKMDNNSKAAGSHHCFKSDDDPES